MHSWLPADLSRGHLVESQLARPPSLVTVLISSFACFILSTGTFLKIAFASLQGIAF